jgi:nitrilase
MDVAVCQMPSGGDVEANLETACALVREAARRGARLVCLPEYFSFYGPQTDWNRVAREATPQVIARMSALALAQRVYLCLGSVLEETSHPEKCASASLVFDPRGREIARYRKMHLFDMDLSGAEYRESQSLVAGDTPRICKVDDWVVGLSICFDLRFPMHYQQLRRMGAEALLVPSAFSAQTGKEHWEPLLRARAIETQCYVVAADLSGPCGAGRICHGHSMIVDPWGTLLTGLEEGTGVAIGSLDRSHLADVRARLPLGFPDA